MERLQKVIANSGFCSRRKAEEFITSGKVKVNGQVITTLGTKVSNKDVIMVNNTLITKDEKKVYYLLNKPRNVISTSKDELERRSVVDLINTDKRIYPVGRLDYDTTGLLILTNDGALANILMHPKNQCNKTYVAKIEGLLTKEELLKLKKGIVIDQRKVQINDVHIRKKDYLKNTSLVEITICEGRNHIVKKIFSSLNHDVIKLTRTKYAFLDLKGLKSGEYRELTIKEVKKLYSLKKS